MRPHSGRACRGPCNQGTGTRGLVDSVEEASSRFPQSSCSFLSLPSATWTSGTSINYVLQELPFSGKKETGEEGIYQAPVCPALFCSRGQCTGSVWQQLPVRMF